MPSPGEREDDDAEQKAPSMAGALQSVLLSREATVDNPDSKPMFLPGGHSSRSYEKYSSGSYRIHLRQEIIAASLQQATEVRHEIQSPSIGSQSG